MQTSANRPGNRDNLRCRFLALRLLPVNPQTVTDTARKTEQSEKLLAAQRIFEGWDTSASDSSSLTLDPIRPRSPGAPLIPRRPLGPCEMKAETHDVAFVKTVFPLFSPCCSLKSAMQSLSSHARACECARARARASDLTSGPAGPSSPRYPGCPVLPGSPWKTSRPPVKSSPLKHFPSLVKSHLAKPRLINTRRSAQI